MKYHTRGGFLGEMYLLVVLEAQSLEIKMSARLVPAEGREGRICSRLFSLACVQILLF